MQLCPKYALKSQITHKNIEYTPIDCIKIGPRITIFYLSQIWGQQHCLNKLIIYLSYLFSTSPQKHFTIFTVQGLSVFHSFMRRSHPLPDQLPTADMAALSIFLLQRDLVMYML